MNEQVRIVDLARRARPERIGLAILVISTQVFLLFMLRSGALSDAWRTLEAHSSRWLIAVAIAMQVVVLAGVVRILRRRKAVLSIDSEEVRFRGHTVPIRSIARLGFYQPAMRRGLSGWYSIETHGGRIVRLEVHPRDHGDRGIAAALDAIEQFSGRRWIGRVESGRSFETLIGAIRRGSGGTWSWLARNTFTIQSHAAEMNDPVYRWTTPLFYVPLIASLLAIAFLLTPGVKLHYGVTKLEDGLDPGTGLAPFPRFLIVMLILGWICTAHGVNLLVLLMRTQTRSREALEAQLNAAREVQMRLLPSAPPEMTGFELSAVCLPALEVGGDYFDFVALPSGKVVAAIGDVSGKGLPAALLMTMVKGCLTTALQGDSNIASAAALIDRSILHASPDRTFVTLALASLEPGSGNVRVVRAGHNQPLLVRNGNSEWISPSGPALGMRLRTSLPRSWDTAELQLERGDLLVLYTDGITEEVSSTDEQYGAERLAAFIRANSNRHLEDLKNAILADVQAFRGRAGTSDDLTLVLIRRS